MLIANTGYYFEKEVEEGSDPKYKVKYFHDEMDYKPTVKFFEFYNDMEDWISEEVQKRVDVQVMEDPDLNREHTEQYEWYLVRIEEIQSCDVDFYAPREI